ncbi:hypothetical protein WJX73_005695 [Symbiochloris irregularis]|uniref:Protein SirB1 N-terminal domain-containing protein n=1 Tax=Symbiochloris irregularis TaxID=706552 RepID=A0AAW1P2F6_9CHLO
MQRAALPFAAAHAVEVGAWMLPTLTAAPCDDDQPATIQEQSKESLQKLDSLAAAVRDSAPRGLFHDAVPPGDDKTMTQPPVSHQQLREQLTVLAQELRLNQGFKVKPFEWLYEQLQPLLLPSVLSRNWGIPLALSIVYTCVGLRLGVSLLPQKVRQSPTEADLTAGILGSVSALPPGPDAWLLHPNDMGGPTSSRDALYLDAAVGKVLTAAECRNLHPHHAGTALGPNAVWAESMRVAVMAHQRAGDGDAVAHCIYQLLALDLNAPEWATMLASRP